jgi:Acetylornithine deacetylase/Succinyl-diaminopimelate desuccinylase and related deacylases
MSAFKGRMWVRITVEGRSAHGGNPSAGINASLFLQFVLNGR